LRTAFVITFFIASRISLFAQGGLMSNPNWCVKPYVNTAAIIQHRSSMGNLIKGYPITYELNIVKPSLGDKSWQLENNLPDYGMNISLVDYANHKELGYGIVLAPFVEIPLNKNVSARRLFLRLCWGGSYMTNHFNIKTNQKNGAIGSAVNAYVQFKWFWRIPLNKKMEIEPGLMFSHVSNGRAQSPNLGLNIFGAGVGLNFRATNKTLPQINKVSYRTTPRTKHEITVLNSYGMNDGTILGPKYLTACLSFGYNYNKRNTHKFGVGFDVFYEQNYVKDLAMANIETDNGFQRMRYGPKIGYSYNIGSISLPIEMGMYVNQAIKPDGNFYNKIGIRYIGPNGLMFGFGLRTHFAVAYDFDLGIGYRLPLGKRIEKN
jgi:hypothetical protein